MLATTFVIRCGYAYEYAGENGIRGRVVWRGKRVVSVLMDTGGLSGWNLGVKWRGGGRILGMGLEIGWLVSWSWSDTRGCEVWK